MKILVSILAGTAGAAAILAASSVLVLGGYDSANNALFKPDEAYLLGNAIPEPATGPDVAETSACVLDLP